MNVTFKVKESFFDRPKVIHALKQAKRRALSKAGSHVRRKARQSMKRVSAKKRAKLAAKGLGTQSAPGSPPNCHAQGSGPSLKTILFAFQPASESTIVGPVQLNQVNFTVSSLTSTVPGLHERGETAIIREYRYQPIDGSGDAVQWRRVDGRRRYEQRSGYRLENRRRIAKYPKRPFMRPALEAEAPNFPELFKNSIVSSR